MKRWRMLSLCVTAALLAGCSAQTAQDTEKDTAEGKGAAAEAENSTAPENAEIILATTTSTQDSGLLEEILPVFEEETGYTVSVVSVGSGEAMEMGENGEADVLLVHSPAAEEEFVAGGHADEDGRLDVMYNDFVLIGPADDPAEISTEAPADAVAAFSKIAQTQMEFISRSDDSGTHKKELEIWDACGIVPEGGWYIEAGAGMGAVLEMANEMLAYTLSDRATWLNLDLDEDLKIVCENDESGILYNQYGVICVNPEKNDQINHEGAKAFQEWIVSDEGQDLIGRYGVEEYGKALFTPNAA